jgi:uncharacterized membrane protein YozB (DUF420 family)
MAARLTPAAAAICFRHMSQIPVSSRQRDRSIDPFRSLATAESTYSSRRRPNRQLWWAVPLLVLALAFVAYSLPPYLTLDPSRSRVPGTREGFPLYYPLLVTHIWFGSVALLAGCLQVWPWFRRRRPVAHRRIGRAYVFAGVLPAGVAVLGVAPLSSTGFVSQVGNTMLALLWLPVTLAGFWMARQRRFVEHREWMIRSYALTTSIVVNRLWGAALFLVLLPQLDSSFGGNQEALINTVANTTVWLSWTVNLLAAEWWLQRGRSARLRRKASAQAA